MITSPLVSYDTYRAACGVSALKMGQIVPRQNVTVTPDEAAALLNERAELRELLAHVAFHGTTITSEIRLRIQHVLEAL